jgi:DNA-binding transcriptional MerR regulator
MAVVPEDKLIYTIGDAARLVDVKPYVLRYWETEFSQLKPEKSVTGQRCYRKRDLRIALTIKRLLHEEKFTIAGARQQLEELGEDGLDMVDLTGASGYTPGSIDGTELDDVAMDPMAAALMYKPPSPETTQAPSLIEDATEEGAVHEVPVWTHAAEMKELTAECLGILQKYN